ncbi:MAG: hypothetical protein ACOYM5_15425 [Caulobacter sp.]
MLELRSPVVLAAAPAGLALACAGWLVLGGAGRVTGPLDEMQAQLNAAPAGRALLGVSSGAAVSSALATPLFVSNATEIAVSLQGLARTPRRAAALLSINGGPAQWLSQGATRDGVTLVQVLSTRVVIDSRAGRSVVLLGETSGGAAGLNGGDAGSDQPPPGTRMPPPPASAPGAP